MTHPDNPELVSVIVPVFNAERFLRATLESVLNQTYPSVEIIAVDDGSNDGSVELIREYSPRVTLIRQANKGSGAARNTGVRAARAEWVAFIDSDDIWTPDKLEVQLKNSVGFAWSHTDAVFVDGVNDGRRHSAFGGKFGGDVLERLICCNFIGTSTVLVRRQVFLDEGGFDESLREIPDWDLWTRIARQYPVAYIDQPLMLYRVHPGATSRNTRRTMPEHLKVIDKVFAPAGPGHAHAFLRRRAVASSYGICSQIADEEGETILALRYALKSWLFEPVAVSRLRRVASTLLGAVHCRGAAKTRIRSHLATR